MPAQSTALSLLTKQISLEDDVWINYLKESNNFLKNGTPKNGNGKPINQVNHVGANLVKMRATRVAMAGVILQAEKSNAKYVKKGRTLDTNKLIGKV